jgi:uncharacterized protein (DUF1015 family)
VGPVFLTYLGGEKITEKISHIANTTQAYSEVVTDDGYKHILHRCSKEDSDWFIAEFGEIPATYVADGHHRTAAAANVGKMRKQAAVDAGIEVKGDEPFNFFMSLIVPGTEIKCFEYNRLVKSLNGHTSEQFKEKMAESFDIEEMREGECPRPEKAHQINMRLDNKWWRCQIK